MAKSVDSTIVLLAGFLLDRALVAYSDSELTFFVEQPSLLVRSIPGILVALYFVIMNSFFSATIGKMIFGLSIVDFRTNKAPLGLAQGISRSLASIAVPITIAISPTLWFYLDPMSFQTQFFELNSPVGLLHIGGWVIGLAVLVTAIISTIHIHNPDRARQSVMDRFSNTIVIKTSIVQADAHTEPISLQERLKNIGKKLILLD